MNNVHVHPTLRARLPRLPEDDIGRELGRQYAAQMWSDPAKLHAVAGEYATDISKNACVDAIHMKQILAGNPSDEDLLLASLRFAHSVITCMDRAVQMVAQARGISDALDASDYTGSPEDAA